MIVKRKDIAKKDRWNVEALYPNLQAWKKDLTKIIKHKKPPFFPEFAKFKGQLQSAATVKKAIELYFSLDRKLSKLYTYAHLRHDEDLANEQYKSAYDLISNYYHAFTEEVSWFLPELQKVNQKILHDSLLKEYRIFFDDLLRLKPHTLDTAEERLVASAGLALSSPHRAFSALSDADFVFGKVTDSSNKEHALTHGSYQLFLRSPDRKLRQNAFELMNGKYSDYQNCLTELLNGNLQKHLFSARARRYDSCLQAALFPKNIDPQVYYTLIDTVHANINSLHRYMQLRKRLQKLKELHLYDMYTTLVPGKEMNVPYQEAEKLVVESVKPLGNQYYKQLKDGLAKKRWVDRFENKNKRSGAYSSGCYDSSPYILMNYNGILRNVFTLAHEAGHSMHSLYSRTEQPYHYSQYEIFVAEVASTFNEELLMQLLLKNAKSKEERAFLINEKLEDIRATLFRQTMFAEFELFLHRAVEERKPLTPESLKQEYLRLNKFYFGSSVVIDPSIAIEWARIPHFYYNFYVYQYATGISAALALSEQVLHGGKKEQNAYLNFLQSGSSDTPLALLKKAGVDMCSPKPVQAAIHKFATLTNELESLLS